MARILLFLFLVAVSPAFGQDSLILKDAYRLYQELKWKEAGEIVRAEGYGLQNEGKYQEGTMVSEQHIKELKGLLIKYISDETGISVNEEEITFEVEEKTMRVVYKYFTLCYIKYDEKDAAADMLEQIIRSSKEITKDPALEKLSSANEGFAFRFYSQLIGEEREKNIIISPLSIAIALSVAYNGAGGDTKEEIEKVLGAAGIKSEDINRAYELFLSNIKRADPEVKIAIANSLWARGDKRFREDFIKTVLNYYGAEASSVDFQKPEIVGKINGWVNEKTRGKISNIVDDTIRDSVLLIINALYFKATWHEVFRPEMTREETFTLMDGTEKKAQMMFQEGSYNYLSNSEFQAISLPYGKDRFSMYIFLPEKSIGIRKFHKLLSQKNWKDWFSQFSKKQGRIGLPKFKQEYGRDLNEVLIKMGMQTAFDPDRVNFEGIFHDGREIFISRIKHKTFIEVNERGTEAAAVTGMEAKEEEPLPEEPFTMIVNRPFFFAIRDNETGMLLFIGSIIDPLG